MIEVEVVAAHHAAGLGRPEYSIARHDGRVGRKQMRLYLRRYAHVLFDAPLLQALFEQALVLDLRRGDVRQHDENLKIAIGERWSIAEAVQVDQPQQPTIAA